MGWAVALVGLFFALINPYLGLGIFSLGSLLIVYEQVDSGIIKAIFGLLALGALVVVIVMFMVGMSVFVGVMGGL